MSRRCSSSEGWNGNAGLLPSSVRVDNCEVIAGERWERRALSGSSADIDKTELRPGEVMSPLMLALLKDSSPAYIPECLTGGEPLSVLGGEVMLSLPCILPAMVMSMAWRGCSSMSPEGGGMGGEGMSGGEPVLLMADGGQDVLPARGQKSVAGWDGLSATSTTSGIDSAPTTPIERCRIQRLFSESTRADSAATTPMPEVSDASKSFQSTTSSFSSCSESSIEFATPSSVPVSMSIQAVCSGKHRAVPPSLRECGRGSGDIEIPSSFLLQRRRSMQLDKRADRVTPNLTVDVMLPTPYQSRRAARQDYNAIVHPPWSTSSSIWWRRQAAFCVAGAWQSVAGLALAGARCERV